MGGARIRRSSQHNRQEDHSQVRKGELQLLYRSRALHLPGAGESLAGTAMPVPGLLIFANLTFIHMYCLCCQLIAAAGVMERPSSPRQLHLGSPCTLFAPCTGRPGKYNRLISTGVLGRKDEANDIEEKPGSDIEGSNSGIPGQKLCITAFSPCKWCCCCILPRFCFVVQYS
jgi:hypothetical protein